MGINVNLEAFEPKRVQCHTQLISMVYLLPSLYLSTYRRLRKVSGDTLEHHVSIKTVISIYYICICIYIYILCTTCIYIYIYISTHAGKKRGS